MAKGKKYKPDLRKIRTSHVYTVHELAKTFGFKTRTIFKWIKRGCPILEGSNPPLIDGAKLKVWLTEFWKARKYPCGLGELFCCKCHKAQLPAPDSLKLKLDTDTKIKITANCLDCGTLQSRCASLGNLDQIQAEFNLQTQAVQHLLGCSDASVTGSILPFSESVNKTTGSTAHLPAKNSLKTGDAQ